MVLGINDSDEKVDFVNNGKQALDLVGQAIDEQNSARYCLIIVECNMHDIEGFETAKKLKKIYSGVFMPKEKQPLVVATSYLN